jgi:hypothetical protein
VNVLEAKLRLKLGNDLGLVKGDEFWGHDEECRWAVPFAASKKATERGWAR